ncbi:MAG: class I SAM-dependent methyltransferase [Gammaproteobacteria bacterium]|nr:class I SAM-dependent methyltransferase [Gammaproteobacteria bacterium]
MAPKIVVKRPILATPLDNIKPTGSISGKTARFDIYAGRPATSTDV